jgi:hypothetical protein
VRSGYFAGFFFFFFLNCLPVFSHTAFTVPFGRPLFPLQFPFCLSQVMRRGSAHSTSHSQTYTTFTDIHNIHRHTQHSQTYTTFIHPWAPFPDGTRTRADLAVVAERVLIFLPPPYRQPLLDIHTHPWPGGVSFLRKNPPPSVGFEPTSAGTATSEHCLRQPCGHRATFCWLLFLVIP